MYGYVGAWNMYMYTFICRYFSSLSWIISRYILKYMWYCPCYHTLHRYLLYDVNPPEGFNLRRDVYIRMASLLKTLRKEGDWVLVLPPWGRLYHWQSPDIHQIRIPWGEFFSLTSLQANIPVIEYEEFIAGETCLLCVLVCIIDKEINS